MESVKHIEKLLDKYFEANTSVAEEAVLQSYFSQEEVAAHLESYRPMFNYFSKAKGERYTKLPTLTGPIKPRRKFNYRWASVAAVAALVFGAYFGNGYRIQIQEDERVQAELAYLETKKALSLLAENFGKGTQKVAYLQEFEATKSKIYNEN